MELKPKPIELPSHQKPNKHDQMSTDTSVRTKYEIRQITTKNRVHQTIYTKIVQTEKILFNLICGFFGCIVSFIFLFAGLMAFLGASQQHVKMDIDTIIFITIFSVLGLWALYAFIKSLIKFVHGLLMLIKFRKQVISDLKKALKNIYTSLAVSEFSPRTEDPSTSFEEDDCSNEGQHVNNKTLHVMQVKQLLSRISLLTFVVVLFCFINGEIFIAILVGFFSSLIRKRILKEVENREMNFHKR